jgi:hypothetical protein
MSPTHTRSKVHMLYQIWIQHARGLKYLNKLGWRKFSDAEL